MVKHQKKLLRSRQKLKLSLSNCLQTRFVACTVPGPNGRVSFTKLQPPESQDGETPRERTEVEERTDPAVLIETGAAVEGEGDRATKESKEKEPEPVEKRDTVERDAAENGKGKEEGGGDGGAGTEGASNERDEGDKVDVAHPAVTEEPQESESTPKERKEKDKKKADKKRKKSKTPREEGIKGSPRSRKRGTKSKGGHNRQLEEILISAFLPFDPEGNGTVDSTTFWEVR